MKIIQPINKNALIIAALSFLIGTIILLSHLITGWKNLVVFGFFFVVVATVLNGITLLGVLANMIVNYHYYKENLITISLIILNIPIAGSYIFIAFNNPFHTIIL